MVDRWNVAEVSWPNCRLFEERSRIEDNSLLLAEEQRSQPKGTGLSLIVVINVRCVAEITWLCGWTGVSRAPYLISFLLLPLVAVAATAAPMDLLISWSCTFVFLWFKYNSLVSTFWIFAHMLSKSKVLSKSLHKSFCSPSTYNRNA